MGAVTELPPDAITALLGQAVSDAFGAPFEYNAEAAEWAKFSLKKRRYLDSVEDVGSPLRWSRLPGLYTDDTQQALILLHAFLHEPDLEQHGILFLRRARKMAATRVKGAKFGVHRGTGGNFRLTVMKNKAVPTAGLGAAMRVGPAAVLLPSLKAAITWAALVSGATTTDPIGIGTASIFAAHCWSVCHEDPEATDDLPSRLAKETMIPEAFGCPERTWRLCLSNLRMVKAGDLKLPLFYAQQFTKKPLQGIAGGFGLTGVPWAITHGLKHDSFEGTLEGVCSEGGDTDTVAAMAGCLAALRLGRDAIPEWMTENLRGLDHLLAPDTWAPVETEKKLTELEVEHHDGLEQALLLEKERSEPGNNSGADPPGP